MKGILLNADGDLDIRNGKIQLGDTQIQDTSIVFGLCQGELKSDPILGPNLIRHIRGKPNRNAVIKKVKIHLARAGINYEEVKEKININLKTI